MSTCYVCNECAKFFTTLQELDAHIKEHYMEVTGTEISGDCTKATNGTNQFIHSDESINASTEQARLFSY